MLLLFLVEFNFKYSIQNNKAFTILANNQKGMKQELKDNKKEVSELLSRGDAIKKIGGYAALTALGTFMILNPQKAQAQSAPGTNSPACQIATFYLALDDWQIK